MSGLEYGVRNRVAWIRLNRPEQKKAFTLEMISPHMAIAQANRDAPNAFNAVREGRRPRFGGA